MNQTKKIDFLFYCPDIETSLCLEEVDSLHAVKVLRMKNLDEIIITNGKGGWFTCKIVDAHPKRCKVSIISAEFFEKAQRQIHVAICPTKNVDRIAYFIEKSVEIGIASVFFVYSQNTVSKNVNVERIKKIAISAMKQSLKPYLPEIFEGQKIQEFFNAVKEYPNKMIAHLDDDFGDITLQKMEENMLILIGPEGDFTQEEILAAKANGFVPVTMGSSRLRTETAGVVAVSLLNLLP